MSKDKTPDEGKAKEEAAAFLAAAQAEADPVTERTVTLDGETFTLPPSDEDWPLDAGLAIGRMAASDGGMEMIAHVELFCSSLLGQEQWNRFRRKKGRPTKDLNRLAGEITKAYGLTTGE